MAGSKKEAKSLGKSKEQKAAAAKKGGKQKKKKWSKGKAREKLVNLVIFDKPTYDKLLKEIPAAKLVTPSTISERLKVNGSLARRAIRELESKGLIKPVSRHHRQAIYTRTSAEKTGGEKPEKPAATGKKGGKEPKESKEAKEAKEAKESKEEK